MRFVFIDSSLLVAARVPTEEHHAACVALLERLAADPDEKPLVSVAVLGEVFATLTSGKGRKDGVPLMNHPEALDELALIARSCVQTDMLTTDMVAVRRAKKKHRDWQIWDCLHWAAARRERCAALFTLDLPANLQSGDVFDGVRFIHPGTSR